MSFDNNSFDQDKFSPQSWLMGVVEAFSSWIVTARRRLRR